MSLLLPFLLSACSDRVHIFEGVEGPDAPTPLIEPVELGPAQFDQGEPSRLAVFITEDESNWLALSSGLKTIGIPFRMTRSIDEAMRHDIVMVYPQITGLNLPIESLEKLRSYTEDGGVLLGTNILGGGLSDMFGFESISESKSRYLLNFQEGFAETANFNSQGLSKVKIGSATDPSFNPGTNSYTAPKNPALVTYENGEAAIISNDYGAGKTYALGIDLGQVLSKGYNRRQQDIAEYYANHYQPVIDACLIFLENVYKEQSQPKALYFVARY